MPHAGTESAARRPTPRPCPVAGRRGPGARRSEPLLRPAGDQGQPPRWPATSRSRRTEACGAGSPSSACGPPARASRGTAQRQRFVMRVVRTVPARVGTEIGVGRLGVRVRAGQTVDDVVIAFPWRHRNWAARWRARRSARSWPPCSTAAPRSRRGRSRPPRGHPRREPGRAHAVLTPQVPVVSITGTNGKTTTTRLMAHMCMTAGLQDGLELDRRRRRHGRDDGGRATSPGPAGARGVLDARRASSRHPRDRPRRNAAQGHGGHGQRRQRRHQRQRRPPRAAGHRHPRPAGRGQGDRHDRDEADGWVVLNGDDPRVWAMRHGIKAKPWAFSLDPASPPCASRSPWAAGASPSSTARSSCCSRTATPTGWSRSSTCR